MGTQLKDRNGSNVFPKVKITDIEDASGQQTTPSVVSVSATGTATEEVGYITINGTEKKLAGGGGGGGSLEIASTIDDYLGRPVNVKIAFDNNYASAISKPYKIGDVLFMISSGQYISFCRKNLFDWATLSKYRSNDIIYGYTPYTMLSNGTDYGILAYYSSKLWIFKTTDLKTFSSPTEVAGLYISSNNSNYGKSFIINNKAYLLYSENNVMKLAESSDLINWTVKAASISTGVNTGLLQCYTNFQTDGTTYFLGSYEASSYSSSAKAFYSTDLSTWTDCSANFNYTVPVSYLNNKWVYYSYASSNKKVYTCDTFDPTKTLWTEDTVTLYDGMTKVIAVSSDANKNKITVGAIDGWSIWIGGSNNFFNEYYVTKNFKDVYMYKIQSAGDYAMNIRVSSKNDPAQDYQTISNIFYFVYKDSFVFLPNSSGHTAANYFFASIISKGLKLNNNQIRENILESVANLAIPCPSTATPKAASGDGSYGTKYFGTAYSSYDHVHPEDITKLKYCTGLNSKLLFYCLYEENLTSTTWPYRTSILNVSTSTNGSNLGIDCQQGVAYFATKNIFIGYYSLTLFTSSDGYHWAALPNNTKVSAWSTVGNNPMIYCSTNYAIAMSQVSYGSPIAYLYSTDGLTWEVRTILSAAVVSAQSAKLVELDNILYYIYYTGNKIYYYYTADGLTWTAGNQITRSSSSYIYSIRDLNSTIILKSDTSHIEQLTKNVDNTLTYNYLTFSTSSSRNNIMYDSTTNKYFWFDRLTYTGLHFYEATSLTDTPTLRVSKLYSPYTEYNIREGISVYCNTGSINKDYYLFFIGTSLYKYYPATNTTIFVQKNSSSIVTGSYVLLNAKNTLYMFGTERVGVNSYATVAIEDFGMTKNEAINVNNDSTQIPAYPTTDGTYTLQVTVTGGVPTFAWVLKQ